MVAKMWKYVVQIVFETRNVARQWKTCEQSWNRPPEVPGIRGRTDQKIQERLNVPYKHFETNAIST